jgi:hypothetical protein
MQRNAVNSTLDREMLTGSLEVRSCRTSSLDSYTPMAIHKYPRPQILENFASRLLCANKLEIAQLVARSGTTRESCQVLWFPFAPWNMGDRS